MNGFILASTEGNAGKTIVTLALLTAFYRNEIPVDVFKNGPDFIDPLLFKELTQESAYNLDTWMMGEANCLETFAEHSSPEHIQIVEGSKGFYDGFSGSSEAGSTAHLAKTLGLPVVLVVNASNTTNTAAAIAHGIKHFDPKVKIAGVILNFVKSEKHKNHLLEAMGQVGIKVYGCVPEEQHLFIDKTLERLLPDPEIGLNRKVIAKLTEIGANNFDLEGLSKLEYVNSFANTPDKIIPVAGKPVIAVARDIAFNFYYEENIDLLRKLGARVYEFSPLEAKQLPDETAAIYIGGGYCGFYGDLLEGNGPLRIEIKRLALCGLPIYSESGGVLYLSKALTQGRYRRTLASVFDFEVQALPEIMNLGYVEVEVSPENPLFQTKDSVRGVQIKVSEIIDRRKNIKHLERPFHLINPDSSIVPIGRIAMNTQASSAHLHFSRNVNMVRSFVEAAEAFDVFQKKANPRT